MPASLIVSALGLSTGGLAAAAVTLGVRLVEAYAVSSLMSRNVESPSQQPLIESNTGGNVQLPPATDNKLPVVYGIQYTSPVIVDAMLSTDQQTMWYVLAFSEATSGNVKFGDIWWDDKLLVFEPSNPADIACWYVPAESGGALANTRVSGVAGDISMWFYDRGSNSETTHRCLNQNDWTFSYQKSNISAIDVLKDPAIPENIRWTANHLMTDTVFAICRVKYDANHGIAGIGQIKAEIINDLFEPGSVIQDYLTNTRYGCAVDIININTASLQALNDFSNDSHSLIDTNGNLQTNSFRYRIDGILDTGRDCMNNLNLLADSADSWIQWDEKNAKWGVVINRSLEENGGSTATVTVITKDQIIGGINVLPTDLNSTANRLTVQYPSFTLRNQTDYRYYELPAEFLSPNEPINELTVSYPFVDNDMQATWLGYKKLWSSREDLVINFTMDYSGIKIDAGDIICVNHEWYGWDAGDVYSDKIYPGKPFRVTQVKEAKDAAGFLSVQISAMSYNGSIYTTTDPGFFEIGEFNYNQLTDPNVISLPGKPTITNINTSSIQSSFQVATTVPAVGRVDAIEFWYSTSTSVTENNFALYQTQYYVTTENSITAARLYPPSSEERVNVTSLPPGTYFWVTRATGPNAASQFSDVSDPIIWTPQDSSGIVDGMSIADYTIPGTKIVTGDPAQSGQQPAQPSQDGGFFNQLGPILGASLAATALYYGYKKGWMDNLLPTELLPSGGGNDPGQTYIDPTAYNRYYDEYGYPVDAPYDGGYMEVIMDATPPYEPPIEYAEGNGWLSGDSDWGSSWW